MLAVARGLGDGVIRYLWRNRCDGEVGLVAPRNNKAASDGSAGFGVDPSYLLMRVRSLPERILELFLGTPGIDVFRPVSENVAVAVGWAHPVELASVASLLPADTYHVFWPGDRVDLLAGPLELSRLADLTRLDLELEGVREPRTGEVIGPDPVAVALRLAPASGLARRVSATLVPLAQTAQFKRLVYLLPPAALRGLRVAVTDRGIVVVASHDLDVIPLGMLLTELAPGIMVPIGMEVVPRVSPEVLAGALGHGLGVLTVFTPDAAPFQLPESKLAPLERRSVARLESHTVEIRNVALDPSGDPTVVNDPLGRFALWGFPEPEQKLLGE